MHAWEEPAVSGVCNFQSVAYAHSTLPLFQTMLTLINKGQKEQMAQLFDGLSDTQSDGLTAEDVQALRRQYEL